MGPGLNIRARARLGDDTTSAGKRKAAPKDRLARAGSGYFFRTQLNFFISAEAPSWNIDHSAVR